MKWANSGPANAIVENVEVHNEKFDNEFTNFDEILNYFNMLF